jgi:hypothetical protein
MSSANHNTVIYRLAQMLVKLNLGEKLFPQQLADEFSVNLRTIQLYPKSPQKRIERPLCLLPRHVQTPITNRDSTFRS